jgi:hypothetical protein
MSMLHESPYCLVGVPLWFGAGSQYNNSFVRGHDFGAALLSLQGLDMLIRNNNLFLPQKAQFFKTKDLRLCIIPWYGSCF